MSEQLAQRSASREAVLRTSILVGIVLYAFTFIGGHYEYCASPKNLEKEVPGRISINTKETKQPGNAYIQPPITNFSFGEGGPAPTTSNTSAEATYYPPERPYFWGRSFFCEANVADFFISWFTLVLAAVTFFLWRETGALARATASSIGTAEASVEALKQSEMAHIHVNRVSFPQKIVDGVYRPVFRVHFQNYGKTPGFIHKTTLHYVPSAKTANLKDLVSGARGGVHESGFSLPPNIEKPASDTYGTEVFTNEEIIALYARTSDLQIFVWGEVIFSPVFNETWASQFAYRISVTDSQQKNVAVGGADYWRYYRIK